MEVIIVVIENIDWFCDLYFMVNEDLNGFVGYGGGGVNFFFFIIIEFMLMVEKKYCVYDFWVIEGVLVGGVFVLYVFI